MSRFADLRLNQGAGRTDESFWPSFTDVMAVVTMIFLITTSFLILRNLDLLRQITTTAEAERMAAALAQSTSAENETLEEQLANAQHLISMLRLELLKSGEDRDRLQQRLQQAEQTITSVQNRATELGTLLGQSRQREARQRTDIEDLRASVAELQFERESLRQTIDTSEQQREALEQALAAGETQRRELSQALSAVEQERRALRRDFEASRQAREDLQARLQRSDQALLALREAEQMRTLEIAELQQRSQQAEQRIGSLRGEYDELKTKYDRLIRPARTAAGKFVVEVRYRKTAADQRRIELREPGDREYRVLSQSQLDGILSGLKAEHGDRLYIKIIFPENSGLTYNEAWSFTSELLSNYDYYYQDPANRP